MSNITRYPQCHMRTALGNCDPIGGFCTSVNESICEGLHKVSIPPGKWIPATWHDEHAPERLKRHKCSECGNRADIVLVRTRLVDNYYCNKSEPITEYTHEEQLSNFCPNCGAHMKGVDDD